MNEQVSAPNPEPSLTAEPAAAPEAKKPLTISEVKSSYIHLPNVFFERRLSPMQFGITLHGFLSAVRLGVEGEDTTKMPGYVICGGFSPVEIAVYAYLCSNPSATLNEIAKKRKLPKRLIAKTLGSLEEAGLFSTVEYGSEKVRKLATLEDLIGPSDLNGPQSPEAP